VECPACGEAYRDWFRASLNLELESFSEDYIHEASTATCPGCGHVVAPLERERERLRPVLCGEADVSDRQGEGREQREPRVCPARRDPIDDDAAEE
jgi:predicted RNA-binding Zn-ribbon protein involved in translation (DUF1610 family)